MNAILTRTQTGDAGSFGTFVMDDGTTFISGELPWRDNLTGKSCIPAGEYRCALYQSPEHGSIYQVENVPNRDYIEIHVANWFGDRSKGLRCDMLGCIGLGMSLGTLAGQQAIIGSGAAILAFMAKQANQPFQLTIVENY